MTDRRPYRGYIGSRPYFGRRTPQHVQNLVIRDYCRRQGVAFRLSATEYAMPGCHMMLEELLGTVAEFGGIVMYSMFMLPARPAARAHVYARILAAGAVLHGAVEELALRGAEDVRRWEDIWLTRHLAGLAAAPEEVIGDGRD